MKTYVILIVMLFAGINTAAFAEDQYDQQPDMQGSEMQNERPRGERSEMMGGNKKGMKGGMMGMQPSVVATSDGGVVVLHGKTLVKYDSNLNLLGEVELKGGPKPMDKKRESVGQVAADPMEMPIAEEGAPKES